MKPPPALPGDWPPPLGTLLSGRGAAPGGGPSANDHLRPAQACADLPDDGRLDPCGPGSLDEVGSVLPSPAKLVPQQPPD